MLPRENLNFVNVRKVGFRHSGRLFRLLQVLSLQNFKNCFKNCFGDPPFKPTMFFYPPSPPFKAPFFPAPPPPLKSRQPPLPDKTSCERSQIKEYLALTTSPSLPLHGLSFLITMWLNPFVSGNYAEKHFLEIVKPFSDQCLAVKGKTAKPFIGRAQFRGLLSQMQYACISFQRPGLLEFRPA